MLPKQGLTPAPLTGLGHRSTSFHSHGWDAFRNEGTIFRSACPMSSSFSNKGCRFLMLLFRDRQDAGEEKGKKKKRERRVMVERNFRGKEVTRICSSYLMDRPLSQSKPNLIR